MNHLEIYLEVGSRRTFAAALAWPGWCRAGRDETGALQALCAYGPRYARVLLPAQLGFQSPGDLSALAVVERLAGNTTTDFGAPDLAPGGDALSLDEVEVKRLEAILVACWRAFDEGLELAAGKPLRTGPRGGGRSLDGMAQHVLEAERGYLSQLGGKAPSGNASESPGPVRRAILEALAASARGEIAPYGPRGGKRWSPRFFARREAWHVLDHLWEIEDRLEERI